MTQSRILLAGLFHETHTFVDEVTGLSEYTINHGPRMLARRGDGSTIDGFLEVADREGWLVVPVCDFSALPSGTTDHAVFELFWKELEQGIRAALAEGGLDGIWLARHGAIGT
ncbi:M81 family metallopeptidase, partial [Devosia sp.]|uniref:M81 family metallopeptidase n=1 Tax=Devosia sp. TaxID=1871048 RepID=UPI001AC6BECD